MARNDPPGWPSLTLAERRIAALVAAGLTNRQVATEMFLSRHTVDYHLRHIFRKLAVTSRVELAAYVARQQPDTDDCEARAPLVSQLT